MESFLNFDFPLKMCVPHFHKEKQKKEFTEHIWMRN